MGLRIVLSHYVNQSGRPGVPYCEALAEVDVAEGVDVDAGGVGEMLVGTGDEVVPGAAGEPGTLQEAPALSPVGSDWTSRDPTVSERPGSPCGIGRRVEPRAGSSR